MTASFIQVTENGDAITKYKGRVRREDDELRFQYRIKFEVRQDTLMKMPIKKIEMWKCNSREKLGNEMKIWKVIGIGIKNRLEKSPREKVRRRRKVNKVELCSPCLLEGEEPEKE